MRFTNLQILRIVGASIVLVYHLNFYAEHQLSVCYAPLKWFGESLVAPAVSVFFALSGFVLMTSLRTTTAGKFALSRLLRIFPAYWAAIALAAIVQRQQGLKWSWDGQVVAGLLLVPAGADHATYRLGIEWTLVFEVFFYLALCLFAMNIRLGPTISVALWLAAVVGAMVVREPGPYESLPNWSAMALSPLTTAFLLGALAVNLKPFGRLLRVLTPVLAPALFITAFRLPRWDLAVLVLGIASALTVAWAAAIRQVRAGHPLVIFGDWSYGLYLIHTPLISGALYFVVRNGWTVPPAIVIVATGLLALIGGLAFGYCESNAYRRLRRRLFGRSIAVNTAPTQLRAA
jgi:exopolysaccharide production protein ExoZ